MSDDVRAIIHAADRAVTDLQTALKLPFRPTGLQPVNDLLVYVDKLHAEKQDLQWELDKARAALEKARGKP